MKYSVMFVCLCLVALLPSCAKRHRTSSKILELYAQIEVGMSQHQVEQILGKPLFPPMHQREVGPEYLGPGDTHPEGDACWYLDNAERAMETHESPWGLGGIKIVYQDGKVVQKKYNFQWVKQEDIDAFEKRTAAQQPPPGDSLKAAPEE